MINPLHDLKFVLETSTCSSRTANYVIPLHGDKFFALLSPTPPIKQNLGNNNNHKKLSQSSAMKQILFVKVCKS